MAGMRQQHFSYVWIESHISIPHCLYCSYTAAGEETHKASTFNGQQPTSSVHLKLFASPSPFHLARSRQESPSSHATAWYLPQHPPPGEIQIIECRDGKSTLVVDFTMSLTWRCAEKSSLAPFLPLSTEIKVIQSSIKMAHADFSQGHCI